MAKRTISINIAIDAISDFRLQRGNQSALLQGKNIDDDFFLFSSIEDDRDDDELTRDDERDRGRKEEPKL